MDGSLNILLGYWTSNKQKSFWKTLKEKNTIQPLKKKKKKNLFERVEFERHGINNVVVDIDVVLEELEEIE